MSATHNPSTMTPAERARKIAAAREHLTQALATLDAIVDDGVNRTRWGRTKYADGVSEVIQSAGLVDEAIHRLDAIATMTKEDGR